MDRDRIDGALKQASGSIKEAFGKFTGDVKSQVDGKAEKLVGKLQNAAGGARDAARDADRGL